MLLTRCTIDHDGSKLQTSTFQALGKPLYVCRSSFMVWAVYHGIVVIQSHSKHAYAYILTPSCVTPMSSKNIADRLHFHPMSVYFVFINPLIAKRSWAIYRSSIFNECCIQLHIFMEGMIWVIYRRIYQIYASDSIMCILCFNWCDRKHCIEGSLMWCETKIYN